MAHGILKKFGFSLLVAGWGIAAAAQTDSIRISKTENDKPLFHVLVNAGLMAGATDRDLCVQGIGGVQYKTWFAGIGSGLDYYYIRSIPLFLQVRKTFSKPHGFFIYADGGPNIPRIKKEQSMREVYTRHSKAGMYYDVGAGWEFKLEKQHAVLFSAGYSQKRSREIQKSLNIPPGVNEELYTTRISYALRRLSIKVGFRF